MNKKTYVALTIGPIYKTFLNVRKTREVWAASYMFSFIMRNILDELKLPHNRYIVPYINDEVFKYKGVGIFPDRFIFESNPGDIENVKNAIEKAIEKFSVYFNENEDEIRLYLHEYFRFCYIEKELEDGANIIEEMFKHLDTLELQNKPMSERLLNTNYLWDFFKNVNKNTKGFFKDNNYKKEDKEYDTLGIKDANKSIRFESVVEIATSEMKHSDELIKRDEGHSYVMGAKYKELVNSYLWAESDGDKDKDEEFINVLKKELPEKFKPFHKYMAIIKADGDKMGGAIASMKGNKDNLGKISKGLLDWALFCDKIVRNYGGIPIYIGGDDLLAFAPVACKDKTIIDLVKEIDKAFAETVGLHKFIPDGSTEQTNATLSYGISINYYKFPLFEAISSVDELLYEAKNSSPERNSACIKLLKHSGNILKTTIQKSKNGNFNAFEELLNEIQSDKFLKEKSFLNSVMYNLRDNEVLLGILGENLERVLNFMNNNFEDFKYEFKESNPKGRYLHKVCNIIVSEFKIADRYFPAEDDAKKKKARENKVTAYALNNIYSKLRISRFIKGLEDDK